MVQLTLDFYRRNYIEGLFLSSGIIRSPDYTMEQLVEVARTLREEHDFRGYIHLKTIPDAAPELLARAGRYADRLSDQHRAAHARQACRRSRPRRTRRRSSARWAAARAHRRRREAAARDAGAQAGLRRARRRAAASRRPARARR